MSRFSVGPMGTRIAFVSLVWVSLLAVSAPGASGQSAAPQVAAGQSESPASHLIVGTPFEETPAFRRYAGIAGRRGEFQETGGRAGRIRWSPDGSAVHFTVGGERKTLRIPEGALGPWVEGTDSAESLADSDKPRGRWSAAGRAEQATIAKSPDGKWKAVYRDFNVWIEADGEAPAGTGAVAPKQLTTDGEERHRYGTGCWVYGEELYQDEAMWWSPDGRRLVFYEVIEDGMKDYYLTFDNTASYTRVEAVRYPKAGDPNPQVNLMMYDRESGAVTRLAISGEPRQYLYRIRFTPDGKQLLVNRTNRRQDLLEVLAIDLATGAERVVVAEKQATWQDNAPLFRFLADGERFVWETESNGWKHYQLRHLDGRLLNTLSEPANYPCEQIVLIDEKAEWFYYTANSDQNPYSAQLHRVRLDGTGHQRITTGPLHHSGFQISPDHRFVVSVREAVDTPHQTVLHECATGRELAVLAIGTAEAAAKAGFPPSELFSFIADDGVTEIWGILYKPSGFDPSRKYPLLIDVYGGPNSRGLNNQWSPVDPKCELGFLVAKVGNRGTTGRGKAFESATYQYLGVADIADQASAVKHLRKNPWVDGGRVAIYGHSYGGYMSALGVLRYPDVFQVGVAGAPVTDWRNYDTIYTERYMRTPQENPAGYDAGSCLPLAKNLVGKLLLVHGLIDDNVHPANTWQLAEALQKENRPFDMMIYPGFKHGIGSNYQKMVLEYLSRHLGGPQPPISPSQPAATGVAPAAEAAPAGNGTR